MKTIYIDCGMGAAGDMLTAALFELLPDKDRFLERMNQLSIPEVSFVPETVKRCGITGTHMKVLISGAEEHEHFHEHEHELHHDHVSAHDHTHHHGHEQEHQHHNTYEHGCEHDHAHGQSHEQEHHHEHEHDHEQEHHHAHHHSSMTDVSRIVSGLAVSDRVKSQVLSVYSHIAEAESQVHGVPVTEIHFHEVGSMDAIADVTAVCLLIEELKVERIVASPVCVGSGQVVCAHGTLPVPAPATANLLMGIPFYAGEIKSELCTPTGAALLKEFVSEFIPMPEMTVEKIGYGMGKKEFPTANCVRAFLGETKEKSETVVELSCNLDDMTGEEIGFAMEELLHAGALDVFTTPIGMKKNRPGILLSVICESRQEELMVKLLFTHTTTLGIRKTCHERYRLERVTEQKNTSLGEISVKYARGYGVSREKIEYEDLAKLARKQNESLKTVRERIEKDVYTGLGVKYGKEKIGETGD